MRKATISKYFIIPTPAFFVCKVNPPIKTADSIRSSSSPLCEIIVPSSFIGGLLNRNIAIIEKLHLMSVMKEHKLLQDKLLKFVLLHN